MNGRLEAIAGELEASGDYRVLRRLVHRSRVNEPDGTATLLGVALDVETTGLDPKGDEIIELAMVPFTFSADGRIFEVREAFHALRQPSRPIPTEITAITGIDDAMVSGRNINLAEVAAVIEDAALIISHHAGFDRPFVERLCPAFEAKCWACSMTEIDWRAEGIESTKLAWLLAEFGFFYERHRATADCYALVELLTKPPIRTDGPSFLAKLLDAARKPTWRIWAAGAPFGCKDTLKARGYRWSPGESTWPKSWYIDISTDDARETEIAFLRQEIFRSNANFRIDKFSAYDRFSEGTAP